MPLACVLAGAALGVTAAVLAVALHLLSPHNDLAGTAIGSGGTMAGILAAGVLQQAATRKDRP